MLRIRFSVKGKRNQRCLWVVVIEGKKKRDSGRFLERIGFSNRHTNEWNINEEKLNKWLELGGQMSLPVKKLLARVRKERLLKKNNSNVFLDSNQ